ncbi:AEC family transporter [Rhodovibrionaceae bacterium A322]
MKIDFMVLVHKSFASCVLDSQGLSGFSQGMEAIINVVLPVFAIMAAGYFAGRTGLLGADSSQALNGFVYYIALPALFFGSMSQVALDEVFNWPFIAAFTGGVLGTFTLCLLVNTFVFPGRLGELTLGGISSIFSNTGYMGIPLLLIAFGEAGVLPAVITTVYNGALVMAFGVIFLEADRHEGQSFVFLLRNAAMGLVKNPLVTSAVLGLVYNALGLPVPKAVDNFCDILGAAAGPCALFAMGLFLVGKKLRDGLGEVIWLTVLKLLLMPAITYYLAFHLFDMDPLWAKAAVVQAALPIGALVFVLASRYDIYEQRASSSILITTLVSVVTLSILFNLLGLG